jgi:hypothetical protein
MKPTLKAPGSKRLKLKYDKMLSSFAFKFNLRRYTGGAQDRACHMLGVHVIQHMLNLRVLS